MPMLDEFDDWKKMVLERADLRVVQLFRGMPHQKSILQPSLVREWSADDFSALEVDGLVDAVGESMQALQDDAAESCFELHALFGSEQFAGPARLQMHVPTPAKPAAAKKKK